MKVSVAPVFQCQTTDPAQLCVFTHNVSKDWYEPRDGQNSFVLQDTSSSFLKNKPTAAFGDAIAVHQLSSTMTMYVYPYDVASKIDQSLAPWNL